MTSKKNEHYKRVVVNNKKARFDYHIVETMEAGIALLGSEVKSIREGKISIAEAYIITKGNEVFMQNSNVNEYKGSNRFNHEPKRLRKLLLHKDQIRRMIGKIAIKGFTCVPISLYFNEKNKIKVEIGLAKGKDKADKRQSIKEKEVNREKARALKGLFD